MNENLKDYFYFSRSEKNGLVILLVIIFLLIIFPYFYDFLNAGNPSDNSRFESEIEQFNQTLSLKDEPEYQNKLDDYIIERYDSLKLFFFNPNNTSKENFIKLGLTEHQTKTVFNYLNKGGQFRVKQDFRKIYGIRPQQYQILEPFILLPDENYLINKNNNAHTQITKDGSADLFVFDPNTATNEDFKTLGLSDNVVKTIRNYLAKIGNFKTKEDFRKIYGIPDEKYIQLEPYISISQADERKIEKIVIELNSAETEDLIKIKGIGKTYAEAIKKYQQKLGGYTNLDQILEIKIIDPEVFTSFKPFLIVDRNKITTLSLNFAETEELASHPYLNYYQAKEIVKFRSINGPFREKKQLVQHKILMEQTFNKIEPYLTLD